MKLDKELVRDILLKVEADGDPEASPIALEFPERTQEEVSYHVMLLQEGGFVKAISFSDKTELVWYPERLTYSGHEFLDAIRDGDVWGKTKAAAEKVGGASVGLVWELAKAEVKAKLGLP